MTNLTAAQITKLTQSLTSIELGRAATREKAEFRFGNFLRARIGDERAPAVLKAVLAAKGFELAEGDLDAAVSAADDEANRISPDEEAAIAAAGQDEAPDEGIDLDDEPGTQPQPQPQPTEETARETKAAAPALETPDAYFTLFEGLANGSIQRSPKRLATLAEAGILPPRPDFSAPSHARFRKVLATVAEAAERHDAEALKAIEVNPMSSSRKAIDAYRLACIRALEVMKAR